MSDGETTPGKHRGLKEPWKPGQSGNPKGRPRGARNKLGEAFLQAMADDFDKHGVTAIARVRSEDPVQYVKVCASILPKELNVKIDPFEELTDDELIDRIRQLESAVEAALGGPGEEQGGTGEEDGAQSTSTLPSIH